ncbi:urease subunit gamma [Haloquadratum walsbyi]|jgi:urease subunit gamma|uniref:Urease, gamma subunit n=1 Tax=Haloquadratum walsbyi J07HQW2 TaxID=1238425 RepID=U1PK60_9EURY|nr:urease subunit gamma [Haloquadratum walsbyi]ERG94062.1 MAG: urease, gamma subunit [Haloquadratum walsbyi J07HQW2]
MNLNPKDRERLELYNAAELARRRKENGVDLNYPECVALISDWVHERAREGEMDVSKISSEATKLLDPEDVRDGIPEMIDSVQTEPVFPDGTKLVTVHNPIRNSPD